MDPDRFQMRDLKRRLSKQEDQIAYLKTDLKRQTQRVNELLRQHADDTRALVKALLDGHKEDQSHQQ